MAGGLSSVEDDVITQNQRFHQNSENSTSQFHNASNGGGSNGGGIVGCGINSLSQSTMPLPNLEDEPHHLENIWVLWFLQVSVIEVFN